MSIEDLKKARIITALVTPFKEDGSINFEALPKLIEHLLAHHTEGLIICSSSKDCKRASSADSRNWYK